MFFATVYTMFMGNIQEYIWVRQSPELLGPGEIPKTYDRADEEGDFTTSNMEYKDKRITRVL